MAAPTRIPTNRRIVASTVGQLTGSLRIGKEGVCCLLRKFQSDNDPNPGVALVPGPHGLARGQVQILLPAPEVRTAVESQPQPGTQPLAARHPELERTGGADAPSHRKQAQIRVPGAEPEAEDDIREQLGGS